MREAEKVEETETSLHEAKEESQVREKQKRTLLGSRDTLSLTIPFSRDWDYRDWESDRILFSSCCIPVVLFFHLDSNDRVPLFLFGEDSSKAIDFLLFCLQHTVSLSGITAPLVLYMFLVSLIPSFLLFSFTDTSAVVDIFTSSSVLGFKLGPC